MSVSFKMEEELQVFQHSIKHLKIKQLWPKKGQTATDSLRLRYVVIVTICSPLLLETILHCIVALKDKMEVDLSEDIGVITAVTGFYFIDLTFVWQQQKIAHLWGMVGDFKEFGIPKNFQERNRRLNLYSSMYAYYCNMAAFVYCTSEMLDTGECHRLNKEKHLSEICGMVTPTWAPFDVESFPNRQIIQFIQCVAVFILGTGTPTVSYTTFEMAEYIVLKLNHLGQLLRQVFDDPDEEVRKKKLVECIRYHQHIIRVQALYSKLYKNCNGSYLVMIAIIFASLANQTIRNGSIAASLHLGGWIFAFFICCYSGQRVLSQSLTICDAAFESKWYEASIPLQKDLCLLIVRAQQPFLLEATPIGTMSLDIFVTMLKTSYSYYALLTQTTQQK